MEYWHHQLVLTTLQPLQPPLARALTRPERTQISRYRSLRDRIHEGPLYTVLGDHARVGKDSSTSTGASTTAAAQIDPFEGGMPTYGMKYRKKRRRIPRLDTRPYVLQFFPAELWSTIEPDHDHLTTTTKNGTNLPLSKKRKRLQISTAHASAGDDPTASSDSDPNEDSDPSAARKTARRKSLLASLLHGDDGNEDDDELDPANPDGIDKPNPAAAGAADDEPEPDEEELDEDYEEDEDDMGGDYNAEQYFDDGGDDYGDDYGGGGGDEDGGGYY
ncbi:MAG: hypothetical protein M1819_004020 [Sarea resinae]|nr:MAG: hypothetical protein M1819_004020 [Sarea resinae]